MRLPVLALVLLAACSSSAPEASTPRCVEYGPYGLPAPPKCVAEPPAGAKRWFAIDTWKLGATNKLTGVASPGAWMDFGFDLDGRITSADDSKNSANSCKRLAGSVIKVLQDGTLGRDDNFGQHVMAVLRSLSSDAEAIANTNMKRRSFFLELDDFTTVDNPHVPGKLHMGDRVAELSAGYVAQGYWISSPTTFELRGVITDTDVGLTLAGGVVTVKLDGSDGTIAGALPTKDLAEGSASMLRHVGFCLGPTNPDTVTQVENTIRYCADLVLDAPSFQDTTRTCDALSIGIGFVARRLDAAPAIATGPDLDPCK